MRSFRITKTLGKRLQYISLSALMLFGALAPAQPARAQTPPTTTQIAIWGDSMTLGLGPYLQDVSGIPVSSNGVGGETIQQTKARFDKWTKPNTLHIIWSGHNNFNMRNQNGHTVESTIAQMAATKPANMFWVLSLTNKPPYGISSIQNPPAKNSTYYTDAILGLNPRLAKTYGSSYVDIHGYLVSNGLADAKLTPTSGDKADIADDIPPRSLRAKSTSGHLNDTGRRIVASKLNSLINQPHNPGNPTPVQPPASPPTVAPNPDDKKSRLFQIIRIILARLQG